ncbi:MAG: HEAT repeat domain-containing protein [Pirellulaceae bacterium]
MTSTTLQHRACVALFTALLAASAENCRAAEAAGKTEHETLIRELGDTDFSVREKAADSLASQGMAAETALREAMRDPDLEIRLRAGEILSRIYNDDLDRRLTEFINSKDEELGKRLAGWKQFRAAVGDDKPSRELFVEVYRSEKDLLTAVDLPRDKRESVFLARVERVQQALYAHLNGVRTPPTPETMAALLLIAAQQEGNASIHAGIQTYSMLSQPDVKKVVTEGDHSAQLQKLLGAWVGQSIKSTSIARYGLMIALQYELKDSTRDLARQLLAEKNASTSVLPYAALAIGKYGDESDIARLEPLLENKTVCHTWHNGKFPDTIKIEVRDVALAVLVELTEQDHKQYGFELLQRNDPTLFQIYTCGFIQNEKREAAVAKWRKWRSS